MPDIIPSEQDVPAASLKVEKYIKAVNREYSLILRGSQVLVMRHWIREDGISCLTFLKPQDFHTLLENERIFSKADNKFMALSKLWMKSRTRAQYEDVYFRPCDKEYKNRYNLWRGFAFESKEGCKHDLFLHHILQNICNSNVEHYEWVIDWLADLIQRPYTKPGTAIVLRGEMGTGKGQFAKHIGKLLGQHFFPILNGSQLTGKFNSHLADKVLVFVDESGWSHDKQGAGIIRGLITESHIAIEMKGKDVITMENYSHFIIAANSEWVVPTSMHDERRFAVFDVGTDHRNDRQYFRKLTEQMENGGYETLLYFLQNCSYNQDSVRSIPITEALIEQKMRSMPDECTWWHDCLVYERVGAYLLNDDNSNCILAEEFYKSYLSWCDKMKRHPLADNILPKNLSKMVILSKKRLSTADGRNHFYFLPSLTEMRENFEKHLGHKFAWPEA